MFKIAALVKKCTPPAMQPGIFFLPFLFLYSLIILLFQKNELTVDEPSYLAFASNLLQGFYSPPPPDIDLWHAPGYPIVLAPFLALKAPLLVIRLCNAVWLYVAVVLFYKLMIKLISAPKALIGSILLGCYWLAYKGLPVIMSETFVFFLITAILYAAEKYLSKEGRAGKHLLLLGFLLGYLCITRFLFGYVMVVLLLLTGLQALRKKQYYAKAFRATTLACLFTIPYLLYTWSLTDRVFYWSNAGGANLYWMSNPADGEWGDWFNEDLEPNWSVDGVTEGAEEQLRINHGKDLEELKRFTGTAKDDLYKQKAWVNIREHPGKFLKNWMANTSRLLFNFPYSYRKTGPGLLFNMLPHLISLLVAIPLLIRARRQRIAIPFFLQFMLLVVLVYFAGSSLLSGHIRMFYVVFPVIACCLLYLWYKTGTRPASSQKTVRNIG